jgi:hypothetical protein
VKANAKPQARFVPAASMNRNDSRRQASGLSFEAILRTLRQVLQIRQFHAVGELRNHKLGTMPQSKQAFSILTPAHRE